MRDFFSLILVQTKGFLLGSGRRKRVSVRQTTGKISTILLLVVAFVFFGFVYSNLFSETLIVTNELFLLLPIMLGISAIFNFFFSFFGTSSVIFGTKDYELLSTLPLKRSTVVLSKITTLVVSDLLLTVCIMVPSYFVYARVGDLTVSVALNIAIMTIVSPLMITAIAILVGVAFSLFASLFRRKELINGLLLLFFMLGVFAVSFTVGFTTSTETGTSGLASGIGRLYFIMPLVIKGVDSLIYTLIFVGVNIASFGLVSFGVVLTYKKINTLLTMRHTVKNFKLKTYTGKSEFKTLISKEFKKLITTPVYFTNVIIGVLMSLLMSISLPVVFVSIDDGSLIGIFEFIIRFAPSVYAFCYLLSPSTVCSISIEGQSFWILRTSPVSTNKIFNAKIIVNLILYFPLAIISSIIAVAVMKIQFGLAVLCVAIAGLLALLGGNFGLLANILFPKLDWTNENQAVKQGASTFLTMVLAFALTGGFVAMGIYVNLSSVWLFVIYASVLALINAVVYFLIMRYGEKLLFKKM